MLGMAARTADVNAQAPTDGELTRTVWASRDELDSLTLAVEGTIARALIDDWAATRPTRPTPQTPNPEGAHPWR